MAELTTQTVAPALPRAQNRVLKKFLANKSAVIGAAVAKKMIPNGYVFSAVVLDGIVGHFDCTLIIT